MNVNAEQSYSYQPTHCCPARISDRMGNSMWILDLVSLNNGWQFWVHRVILTVYISLDLIELKGTVVPEVCALLSAFSSS